LIERVVYTYEYEYEYEYVEKFSLFVLLLHSVCV
jgi:hypothetical protein